MAIDPNEIARIIEPSLDAMGYRLVRLMQTGGLRRPTLQVMAERRDEAPMTVEDCAEISRAVSALLDVADPIASAYMLEVSSPGIDRPLVRPEDYDRFAGFEARIDLATRSISRARAARKRFRGRILGRDGDHVRLAAEKRRGAPAARRDRQGKTRSERRTPRAGPAQARPDALIQTRR